jgi:ATP-dependent DNA helicase RecG
LQVAIMAPTEILAEQLFHVYQSFFTTKSLEIALLKASTKGKEKKLILKKISAQELTILIGTHALLSEDIRFKRLGLVIIDEQHRFGVKQRAELLKSCTASQEFCPHLLVMSATPIPRSLALTVYGDLDLSVIDEKPPGRLLVHTQAFFGPVLKTMERLCERIILTKQKAFIVFPLVEESENLDLENATKAFKILQDKFGISSSVLLHGKMRPEEKVLAIEKFKQGIVSFLVATTIVEVGVDIPDATCMLIVHPERFGLAQLHQLRGRVGRKNLKSFCFLITDLSNKFGSAFKRLTAMCKTDNGFKLAEIDLEIRGPGELLGVKQSGVPNFMVFSHHEFTDLVAPAKNYAKTIAQNGAKKEHTHLFLHKEAHFS